MKDFAAMSKDELVTLLEAIYNAMYTSDDAAEFYVCVSEMLNEEPGDASP